MSCEICGGQGYLRELNKWKRCECLLREREKQIFHDIADVAPAKSTVLTEHLDKCILLGLDDYADRSLNNLKPHLLCLVRRDPGLKIVARVVYALLDEWLHGEEGIRITRDWYDPDILIIGMKGALPNKFLPKMLAAVVELRQSRKKATWFVVDTLAGAETSFKRLGDDVAVIMYHVARMQKVKLK